MKKINICVLVLLIIFTSNILAEVSSTDNLTKILLKIENSSKKINTLKMDYVQNVFYEYTKEREEIAGTLFLKKPRYMYIKQLLPLEQQIYIDDKKILIYTPKDKQVVVDDLKNVIGVYFLPSLILNFGSGWREIKKTNIIS
ncbi:MAG: outer membrane lipoprotein carrier protein LolA, partial [Endomicrobium sp.]|nr:outer membrane lipoprotein carrier protein LolA [Endomicrobium sp.]